MRDPDADSRQPGNDPLLTGMRVERVTRSDGRYLLYYAWPPAGAQPDEPDVAARESAAEGDDV